MEPSNLIYDESLGHFIGRTSRVFVNRLQHLFSKSGYDLTFEQWLILLVLSFQDGQFQQQIADRTSKDKTTITRVIEGMVKRDLVKKIPDESDKRQNRIYLTDKGKTLRKELKPIIQKNWCEAKKDIAPEQLEICKNVLVKIHDNILGMRNAS